jgi:hypothetical protein
VGWNNYIFKWDKELIMAYKTVVAKACATRDIALTELWSTLSGIGWTLVDGSVTPSTFSYTDVDTTNNWCTVSGHNYLSGTPVQLKTTGTAPGGLAVLTQYYVVNPTTDTFKLATTYNGSAIDITTQGTDNHTIAESYRIYSSNGESGTKIAECIMIHFWASATLIKARSIAYWNTTTKSAIASSYVSNDGSITTNGTGFYLFIYGNKDMIYIWTKISSIYYMLFFGHVKSYFNLLTPLTTSGISGSLSTLTVSGTSGFVPGDSYQILGASSEGRDTVVVSSITNSTQMVISNLPRNYSPGSLIGINPSTFGHNGGASWQNTCPSNVVGTATGGQTNAVILGYMNISDLDPDYRTGKYILCPWRIYGEYDNAGSQSNIGYYIDEYCLFASNTGLTAEDTFAVTKIDYGTSTGTDNTSTIIYDTGKSWATNAFANKVLIISFGTGIGQIKKIASNTATTIDLASGWIFETIPDATSQYIICEEGYRYFILSTLYFAYREGY